MMFCFQGTPIPFYLSACLAGMGGFAGGFVGNPADLVNVRMQNDIKLPPAQRRKYATIWFLNYILLI